MKSLPTSMLNPSPGNYRSTEDLFRPWLQSSATHVHRARNGTENQDERLRTERLITIKLTKQGLKDFQMASWALIIHDESVGRELKWCTSF